MRKDTFWICENLGDAFRHSDFIDGQVRIRRNDGSAREIDTLAAQVTAEPTLLTLEALAKATYGLVPTHRRYAGHFRVDVQSHTELKKVPLFHQLGRRRAFAAFGQTRLDNIVRKDNLGQLHGQIILVGSAILSHAWANAHWRHADILPDILLWAAELRFESEQLAVLVRDAAEQVEYAQWIQVFLCLVQVRRQFAVTHLDGGRKRLAEIQLLFFGLFLSKLLVDDLEHTCLFDRAVGRATMWAVKDFARRCVHGLECLGALQVLEAWPTEATKKATAIWLLK